jgi:hypothetical protein
MKILVPGKQAWMFPLFAMQFLYYQQKNQETAGLLSAVKLIILKLKSPLFDVALTVHRR